MCTPSGTGYQLSADGIPPAGRAPARLQHAAPVPLLPLRKELDSLYTVIAPQEAPSRVTPRKTLHVERLRRHYERRSGRSHLIAVIAEPSPARRRTWGCNPRSRPQGSPLHSEMGRGDVCFSRHCSWRCWSRPGHEPLRHRAGRLGGDAPAYRQPETSHRGDGGRAAERRAPRIPRPRPGGPLRPAPRSAPASAVPTATYKRRLRVSRYWGHSPPAVSAGTACARRPAR